MKRRRFFKAAVACSLVPGLPCSWVPAAPTYDFPRITFYGAARQVSGSCHLLETTKGLYLVDCGRFISSDQESDGENRDFPFDPREVKAVFLTHAHADHHGRLPLLYRMGFRGKIYCTDATRDLCSLTLSSGPVDQDADQALFSRADVQGTLRLIEAVPYNQQLPIDDLVVRYTDAGHILGSAMIECWVDGRKILFGGDIGPDDTPILHPPAQHFHADALLVESTYGPVRRSFPDESEFARRVSQVIEQGGSVLIPVFAVHKSQLVIHAIHRLVESGLLSDQVPIYSDSGTVHRANRIYDAYQEYHDEQAVKFAQKHGSLFYLGKYREGRTEDFLTAHGGTPSIFVATSGMLAFAASPRHLAAMAGDPKNALLIPGYQAPGTVGRQLLDGQRDVSLTLQEFIDGRRQTREASVRVKMSVDRISGFSSHASGEQILQWVSRFESLGDVYTVHGDPENAISMADALTDMGLSAQAPERNESFTIKSAGIKPGPVPSLPESRSWTPASVD